MTHPTWSANFYTKKSPLAHDIWGQNYNGPDNGLRAHPLYFVVWKIFRGPPKVSRRDTETWRLFWHRNQFTEQNVSLPTYANN